MVVLHYHNILLKLVENFYRTIIWLVLLYNTEYQGCKETYSHEYSRNVYVSLDL